MPPWRVPLPIVKKLDSFQKHIIYTSLFAAKSHSMIQIIENKNKQQT